VFSKTPNQLEIVMNKKIYQLTILLVMTLFFTSCEVIYVEGEEPYDVRDNYTGEFYVYEPCGYDTVEYDLLIVKEYSSNEISFQGNGLYDVGVAITAIITGNKLIIPTQRVEVSHYPLIEYEFSGRGSLYNGVLQIDYQVITFEDGWERDRDYCTAYGERPIY
jgi:hypothetical protein